MSAGYDLLKGLKVTFRELFRKSVTDKYPKEFRDKPQRFHGRHVLNKYEDGMEKCIGCELCAGACPAQCIYVRGEDNPEDNPVSPGERYGFIYEINMLRCIYCALCVEACPTEAITMTSLFEMSVANRSEAVFDKSVLLVDEEGNPKTHEEQTKLTNPEELKKADGWMRATSSSGNPEFEDTVGWTGSLGVGEREPEKGQSLEEE
ncbi:MAG: NADH-quinone oxidoreductase subunit NuoI [Actinomycetota bacterium]|nr:NADH-quinone oxidoreductase subunit NuoI [Actinomycetota bacterium]